MKKWIDVKLTVAVRSQGRCEANLPTICLGRATNFHHRRLQGQGGPDTPENVLHLCGSGTTGCHGWIHNHVGRSYELGLLLRHGQDPATTPVVPV